MRIIVDARHSRSYADSVKTHCGGVVNFPTTQRDREPQGHDNEASYRDLFILSAIQNVLLLARGLRIAKVVFCMSWFILGLTQALIGFLNNGQCDKSKHLPMFLGIHGMINGVCGIIVMPCFLIEHNGFYARLIFYTYWAINGILILYGIIQSGVTHADILSCVQNCESCSNVVSVGALITEILICIMFFFASIIAIAHECRTRGHFCHGNSRTQNNTSYDPANQQEQHIGRIPSAPPAYR